MTTTRPIGGHDKGGLIAIAQIETVGATGSLVVRKDLGITKMSDLKGKKIANQTGSSIGNIFVDQVGPANGLKKGEFQEVRMEPGPPPRSQDVS